MCVCMHVCTHSTQCRIKRVSPWAVASLLWFVLAHCYDVCVWYPHAYTYCSCQCLWLFVSSLAADILVWFVFAHCQHACMWVCMYTSHETFSGEVRNVLVTHLRWIRNVLVTHLMWIRNVTHLMWIRNVLVTHLRWSKRCSRDFMWCNLRSSNTLVTAYMYVCLCV